jgi:hypothetical protein
MLQILGEKNVLECFHLILFGSLRLIWIPIIVPVQMSNVTC